MIKVFSVFFFTIGTFVTIIVIIIIILIITNIYFCCLESDLMPFFLISIDCKILVSTIVSLVPFGRDVFQLKFTLSINQLRNARAMNPPKTKFIVDTTPIVIKTIHVNWKMKMKTRYIR